MKKPRNWGQPCPNVTCSEYGRNSQGNICAVSTYPTKSGKRRIFTCKTWGTLFSETRDKVFYDLRTSEDKVIMALKMILVKVTLSGIALYIVKSSIEH